MEKNKTSEEMNPVRSFLKSDVGFHVAFNLSALTVLEPKGFSIKTKMDALSIT